jgi:hypothetical protein
MLLDNLIPSLPSGHPARRYSAKFFAVTNYFLSLSKLPGFDVPFERFRAFDIDPNFSDKKLTDEEVAWISFCTELNAYYIIGNCLGLSITGFEQSSPRRLLCKGETCDFSAKKAEATLYFEVKRKSGEERNSLPVTDGEANLDQAREYTPDRIEDIEAWLLGPGGISSNSGQQKVPMVEAARTKGADYLTCMVPGWERLENIVTKCFRNTYRTARTPQTFISSDARMKDLLGIMFITDDYDNFCLINSANPEANLIGRSGTQLRGR